MAKLWIPAERFLAVVDRPGRPRVGKQSVMGRRLSELRSGRQAFIRLETADKILTGLDMSHWFHIPADQGGLADIYEEGKQYGAPGYRYETEEERIAARRRSGRESMRRRRLDGKAA